MMRRLLVRGMLVGLLAGVLGFGVAHTIGEPPVNKAIAFESYVSHSHHEADGMELVSRSVQSTAGLGLGTLVFGVALGGLFALAFAVAYGRMDALRARGSGLLLGGLGLVSIYVVPILKYPANPPSIGQADTINQRTELYLIMILLSVIITIVTLRLRQRFLPRFGAWNGTLLAGAAYVVLVTACYVLLPGVNEVPQQAIPGVVHAVTNDGVTFPSAVLWRFRVASLAIQIVLWGTLALGFGVLAERLLEPGSDDAAAEPHGNVDTL